MSDTWKRLDWLKLPTASQGRAITAAVPLVLVNTVAFAGQLAFLRSHLPWPLAGQVTVAVALESIAVFLALHAHVAALADDSALRLRLAAYAFAAVIGVMNYSHYAAPHWHPTFAAVAVGLMSASSPWLWSVHSRRVSRDALMARGLVEAHALRLGATRWMWHPVRSTRVMWNATWEGVADPQEAVSRWGKRSKVNEVNREAEALPQAAAVPPVAEPLPVTPSPVPVTTAPKRKPAKRQSSREATDARDLRTITAMLADGDVTVAAVQKRLGTRFDRARRLLAQAQGVGTMQEFVPEPAVLGNGAAVH